MLPSSPGIPQHPNRFLHPGGYLCTYFCNVWGFSALVLLLNFSEEQLEPLEFNELMLSPGKAGMGRCLGRREPVPPAVPATTFSSKRGFLQMAKLLKTQQIPKSVPYVRGWWYHDTHFILSMTLLAILLNYSLARVVF